MRPTAIKVGELAKRAGVSVRTLHHYDAIGLLTPTQHSAVGYRLYDADNIVRLQQIRSLRQLGLTLDEVREFLSRPEVSPQQVIELHIARLREEIVMARELCDRLDGIARTLTVLGEDTVEVVFATLEVMNKMDTYYTDEQREYLRQRRETVGEARIREVEAEWPRLMAEVRAAMDAGVDPADPQAQALAQRWMGLVAEFTGGDAGIQQSLNRMYENEKPQDIHPSLDPQMAEYGAYIRKAMAAGGGQ